MWKRVLVVACVVSVCWGCRSPQTVEIRLRAVDSPLGERSAMSNLFFEAKDSASAPLAWGSVEAAVLTEVAGREVRLVRGRVESRWEYRVDDGGDGTVENNDPLQFSEADGLMAAVVELAPDAPGTAGLRLHVLTADGYVYGRPARSWHGRFRADGHTVAVGVRAVSRMRPIPRDGLPFELLVDLDGDGEFRERSVVQPGGGAVRAEVLRPDQPFRVGSRSYRLESVDIDSSRIRVRPTSEAVAAAPDFLAPPVVTTTLDGRSVSLDDLRGNVVVVEFWSIHCPFSEQIRPQIRSLEEQFESDVRWITIARETEADAIRTHLESHPMAGEPWTNRANAWEIYNPGTITPLFYVIDRSGLIVAIEKGAGAAALLEAWLRGAVSAAVDDW